MQSWVLASSKSIGPIRGEIRNPDYHCSGTMDVGLARMTFEFICEVSVLRFVSIRSAIKIGIQAGDLDVIALNAPSRLLTTDLTPY